MNKVFNEATAKPPAIADMASAAGNPTACARIKNTQAASARSSAAANQNTGSRGTLK